LLVATGIEEQYGSKGERHGADAGHANTHLLARSIGKLEIFILYAFAEQRDDEAGDADYLQCHNASHELRPVSA
jgi:hypothetical protein